MHACRQAGRQARLALATLELSGWALASLGYVATTHQFSLNEICFTACMLGSYSPHFIIRIQGEPACMHAVLPADGGG
jgi:hypothetical protein